MTSHHRGLRNESIRSPTCAQLAVHLLAGALLGIEVCVLWRRVLMS